jgi:heat shock protein HtpX
MASTVFLRVSVALRFLVSMVLLVGGILLLVVWFVWGSLERFLGSSTMPQVLAISTALVVLVVVPSMSKQAAKLQAQAERSVRGRTRNAADSPAARHLERLCMQADIERPTLRLVEDPTPEAFTVGSGASASVVISTGLVDLLTERELEAILAHEVAHLANGDSRLMAYALAPVVHVDENSDLENGPGVFNRFLVWYGQRAVGLFSRGREWAADAAAVELSGSPMALASALRKIDGRELPDEDLRTAWPTAVAALNVSPNLRTLSTFVWTVRTHPTTEARVNRLEWVAGRQETA